MKKFLLIAIFFTNLTLFAQSDVNLLVETTSSSSMNVCGDEVSFSIKFSNRSSQTVTSLVYQSSLPDGVQIVDILGGLINSGSSQEPSISIPDIPGNTNFTLNYTAKANCSLISNILVTDGNVQINIQNTNSINYRLNNSDPIINISGSSESYNIRFPEIEVKIADADVNKFFGILEKDLDGTVFERNLEISNSGIGSVEELTFYLDYDNIITFNNLKIGALELVPVSNGISPLGTNFTRNTYKIIDFSGIGDGDNLFEQNEKISLIDNISLFPGDCQAAIETNYTVNWGCNETLCNSGDAEATSKNYISFVAGRPSISTVMTQLSTGNFCGQQVEYEISLTNRGTGSVPNEADSAIGFRIYDERADNRYLYTESQHYYLGNIEIFTGHHDPRYFIVDLDDNPVVSSDPDGPGGLEDVDKDGFFDDLPQGNTAKIRTVVKLKWDDSSFSGLFGGLSFSHFIGYYDNNECIPSNYGYGLGSRIIGIAYNEKYSEIPEELPAGGESKIFKFTVRRQITGNGGQTPQMEFGSFFSDFDLPSNYVVDKVDYISTDFGFRIQSTTTLPVETLENGNFRVYGGSQVGYYLVTARALCPNETVEAAPEIDQVSWEMKLGSLSLIHI